MRQNIPGPLTLIAVAVMIPAIGLADDDDDFEQYLFDTCNTAPTPPEWDAATLGQLCFDAFPGGFAGGSAAYDSSSNLGTSGAQTTSANAVAVNQQKSIEDRLEELKEETGPRDQGGWGYLLSVQGGESERDETELEQGYDSDLGGVLLGLDRRFSDRFVLGAALGITNEEASFDNNGGDLDTSANTLMVYGTWAVSATAYVDAYIGTTQLSFDSVRTIVFNTDGGAPIIGIDGEATADFDGTQTLLGLSAGKDWNLDATSYGVFFNFDYSDTEIDAYDESGNTNTELSTPDQTTKSELASIGVRLSHTVNQGWGVLVPNARVALVHESRDDARSIDKSLVITPGNVFTVDTDEPDRDYALIGVGVTAALNSGTQIFVDYEQTARHDFLDTWAVSIGILAEF